MSGEDVRWDRVTKRDYWVDVYEQGGVGVGFLLADKSLDEVFEYMTAYFKQGGNAENFYEVKIQSRVV